MKRVNTSKKTASKKLSKTSSKLMSIPGFKEYNPNVYHNWLGYYRYYTYFYADYINYKYDNAIAYKGKSLEFNGGHIMIQDTFSRKQILKSQNHLNDFTKFVTNTNKRFLIIPIGINFLIAHANILIYDTVKNELELYDPQGHTARTVFKTFGVSEVYDLYIEKIKELMNIVLKTQYKFYEIASFLPENEEFQTAEIEVCPKEKFKINTPIGFCVVWTLWYAETRIKYPSLDRETLLKKLKKNLEQNIKSSRKTQTIAEPKICRVIRGYTVFLTELDKNKSFRQKYILFFKLHTDIYYRKLIFNSILVSLGVIYYKLFTKFLNR